MDRQTDRVWKCRCCSLIKFLHRIIVVWWFKNKDFVLKFTRNEFHLLLCHSLLINKAKSHVPVNSSREVFGLSVQFPETICRAQERERQTVEEWNGIQVQIHLEGVQWNKRLLFYVPVGDTCHHPYLHSINEFLNGFKGMITN